MPDAIPAPHAAALAQPQIPTPPTGHISRVRTNARF